MTGLIYSRSVRRCTRFLRLALVAAFACCTPEASGPVNDRAQCHLGQQTRGTRSVTWRQLVDDPVAFEGRPVRMVGRLRLWFEDYSFRPAGATRSYGVWVDLDDAIDERAAARACHGALVAVEGRLTFERNGHMGMFPGTLVVRRVDALDAVDLDESDATEPQPLPRTVEPHVVTVEEYDACVRARRCVRLTPNDRLRIYGGESHGGEACNALVPSRSVFPMNCVRWIDAARYCSWAGKRLPTDQEWFSAMGFQPPRESSELTLAGREFLGAAVTQAVDLAVRDVVTNGVAEWTRSPTCTEKDCLDFHRVIVRERTTGVPVRLDDWRHGFASPQLGFRCAR